MLIVGQKAPDFTAPDQAGRTVSLADYRGRWLLLYFYPKDNTPGCTEEACQLRDREPDFSQLGASIIGVSADTVASHAKFADKYGLPFPLLADSGRQIAAAYEVKGFIRRSSYLIDPEGKIAKAYERVKPALHAAEVVRDLAALKQS